MNETLVHNRLSRNGPVSLEVSAALTSMDIGRDVTRSWQRLDEFVTTDSNFECDRIIAEALAIADRLYNAQVGLAEAVYRREWNEDWAPLMSCVIPGTRSGGLAGCRFEHPDEHSNGPMSSLRLRMNSLAIDTVQSGPNDCMVETAWYAMTKAERMFFTKGNWHIEWKYSPSAKENVTHDLVNVYEWVMLPASVGEKCYQNGAIDLAEWELQCLVGNAKDCAMVLPGLLRGECSY